MEDMSFSIIILLTCRSTDFWTRVFQTLAEDLRLNHVKENKTHRNIKYRHVKRRY